MPAPLMHLWSAKNAADEIPHFQNHLQEFYLGTLFPDLGYWPTGDRIMSDLAHYVKSEKLPRKMIEYSQDDPAWQAFSWGWLLHVYVDIYGHPYVNKIAGEFTGKNVPMTYEDDQIIHSEVEQGFDFDLHDLENLITTSTFFQKITPQSPLCRAYEEIYGYQLDHTHMQQIAKSSPSYLKKMIWLRKIFNNKNLRPILKVMLSTFSPTICSVFYPSHVPDNLVQNLKNHIQDAVVLWIKYHRGIQIWDKKNRNLDTGKIVKRGEYKLADMTMSWLEKHRGVFARKNVLMHAS